MKNINTKEYWDQRFATHDWEKKNGRLQTTQFAESQVNLLNLSTNYSGTIVDYGCGLGDAIPVYKSHFPNAKIIGYDISEAAITMCRNTYGDLAEFKCGTEKDVDYCDMIISSNVFEHLSDDKTIAQILLEKCKTLVIVVPYKEVLSFDNEHVNSYDDKSFDCFANVTFRVFNSRGFSQYGFNLIYNVYFKNIFRVLVGKKLVRRNKQIMFIIENIKN